MTVSLCWWGAAPRWTGLLPLLAGQGAGTMRDHPQNRSQNLEGRARLLLAQGQSGFSEGPWELAIAGSWEGLAGSAELPPAGPVWIAGMASAVGQAYGLCRS